MNTPPTHIGIYQAGKVAAVCTATHVHLSPAVEGMPHYHPDKVRILCKAMIAGLILNGRVSGPYVDEEAELAADLMLEQRGG